MSLARFSVVESAWWLRSASRHSFEGTFNSPIMQETFDVFVEIPKGSRNKYELDKQTGQIRFDRLLYSSMHYPSDYGFFPNTLGQDGDPLDALVLMTYPTFPGCVIEVRVVGVFMMTDDMGPDAKVLCVPVGDPRHAHIRSIDDLDEHYLKEVEHFFETYKDLEHKKVQCEGWEGREKALELIREAQERYTR